MSQPNMQPVAKSDNTIWIYLSYILGFIFGLIGLAVVKDDEHVRFHCAQAFTFQAAAFIIASILDITVILLPLGLLVSFGAFVYGIIVALKAAKGEKVRIPVCGDFAEKNVINWFK